RRRTACSLRSMAQARVVEVSVDVKLRSGTRYCGGRYSIDVHDTVHAAKKKLWEQVAAAHDRPPFATEHRERELGHNGNGRCHESRIIVRVPGNGGLKMALPCDKTV